MIWSSEFSVVELTSSFRPAGRRHAHRVNALPARFHACIHRTRRARFEQRRGRIGPVDDTGRGDIGLVADVSCFDIGRIGSTIVDARLEAPDRVGFGFQRVGAVDEIGFRHPFEIGADIKSVGMLIEQFPSKVVTRRARQQIVAEGPVIIEAEITECIGKIKPDFVRCITGNEDVLEDRSARPGLDTLVDGAIEIGDIAIAKRTELALQLVTDVGACLLYTSPSPRDRS